MTVVFALFYIDLYFFKSCLLLRPESYTGRIQEVDFDAFIFYTVDEQKSHVTMMKADFFKLNIVDIGQFDVYISSCPLEKKSTPAFALDAKAILK